MSFENEGLKINQKADNKTPELSAEASVEDAQKNPNGAEASFEREKPETNYDKYSLI